MCGGASSTQVELQNEEAAFYKTQVDAYNRAYANYSEIQDALRKQFEPIIAKGPNQMGFNDAELNNLNTQATEGTATNYAAAKRALQEDIATEGGGTSNVNLTSGGSTQARAQLASTAAAVESAEQLQIQQAGYQQGYQEYRDAVAGEENVAAGWNPNAFSGSAVSAGSSANAEANAVTQANQSIWQGVLGALGGVASNFATPGGWKL